MAVEEFQRSRVGEVQPLADGEQGRRLQERLPGVGEGQHVVGTRMEVVYQHLHTVEQFERHCRDVVQPLLKGQSGPNFKVLAFDKTVDANPRYR